LVALLSLSFFMTACGGGSKSSNNNDQGQQQGPPGKPTVTLAANPTTISGDEASSHLSWTSTNATSVSITPIGAVTSTNGAIDVSPEDTTTYTATATGPGGTSDPQSVTVTVAKELNLLFQANPPVITPGQSSTLTWTTKGALALSIDNGVGSQSSIASGSVSVSPTTTTTYTATANGTNSQASTSQVTVTVQPVIVTLTSNQLCINSGGNATLSYTSQGAAAISIDNGVGDQQPPSGSVSVSPTSTTTYTATATDASNHVATSQVTVQVGNCGGINQVKHIIFLMQENRSFDNYFGLLGAYRGSKGFSTDVDGFDPNKGLPDRADPSHLIKPYHFRTQCTKLVTPGWNESHYDVHYSASTNSYQSSSTPMEGFLKTTNSVEWGNDPTGERAMGYYDQTDLPYYYELATQYATSDRWFSAALAPTIPNRMYLLTGTSFGFIRPDVHGHAPYPQKTFFRALTEAGISWRYYYQDSSVYLFEFADWATEQGKVRNISEYYNILAGADADTKLPQVIFIERKGSTAPLLDEHPHGAGVQFGSANTKKMIDALMNSAAWKSSVFLLDYDEGGGFYDHVPPMAVTPPDGTPPNLQAGDHTGDFATSGFRTPMILVSPFVKPHYLSHTPMESTSIWKFIETRFGMAPLTQRDATANDMTEFFDFANPPRLAIPPLPDQPTSEPCDDSLQTDPNQP
jgi:phospholipase C